MSGRLLLASPSRAMDGSLTAVADCSRIFAIVIPLHQMLVPIDIPLRATGDADFGVPPYLLNIPGLIEALEALGYVRVAGNRWERRVDGSRTAAVDLLVPTYRSRARNSVQFGEVTSTEVPGLAEAFRRPGLAIELEIVMTSGGREASTVVMPDIAATLALKTWARTVRQEDRDVVDIWRCLEVAFASGVTRDVFDDDSGLALTVPLLEKEFERGSAAYAVLTRGLSSEEAARRRTKVRALLAAVVGIE